METELIKNYRYNLICRLLTTKSVDVKKNEGAIKIVCNVLNDILNEDLNINVDDCNDVAIMIIYELAINNEKKTHDQVKKLFLEMLKKKSETLVVDSSGRAFEAEPDLGSEQKIVDELNNYRVMVEKKYGKKIQLDVLIQGIDHKVRGSFDNRPITINPMTAPKLAKLNAT